MNGIVQPYYLSSTPYGHFERISKSLKYIIDINTPKSLQKLIANISFHKISVIDWIIWNKLYLLNLSCSQLKSTNDLCVWV